MENTGQYVEKRSKKGECANESATISIVGSDNHSGWIDRRRYVELGVYCEVGNSTGDKT